MSASNQKSEIVHQGGQQTALGDADSCLNGRWDNTAPAENLAQASSARTQIEGNPIAMVGTKWDPSESGGKIGVSSGTTKKEAEVVEGSRDLFVEGRPAARTNDPTTQNHGNSAGGVKPAALAPAIEATGAKADNRCTIVAWEGVSRAGIPLGYPGRDKTGAPYYLEVWDTDILTFKSHRKDITKTPPADSPACEFEPHTAWLAKGKVFPLYLKEEEETEEGTETFTVHAHMVTETWASAGVLAALKDGDEAAIADALAAAADRRLKKIVDPHPDERTEGVKDGATGKSYAKDVATPGRPKKPEKVIEVELKELLFYGRWFLSPPEIKVTAKACGGARDAVIKVLPNAKIEMVFDLAAAVEKLEKKVEAKTEAAEDARSAIEKAEKDRGLALSAVDKASRARERAIDSIGHAMNDKRAAETRRAAAKADKRLDKANDRARQEWKNMKQALARFENAEAQIKKAITVLKTAENGLSIMQKVADVAGTPFQYAFLKECKLKVAMSYERTTERMSARGWRYYTNATMGQRWKFTLECGKLLSFKYTATFSIFNFAGPYLAAVAQALRRFRIANADIFFSASLSFGMAFSCTKTEVDEFTVDGEGKVSFQPSMGAVVGGASVDVVKFIATFPSELKFGVEPPASKGPLITVKPSAKVDNFYSCTFFPDRWYKIEAFGGRIEPLLYRWNADGKLKWELFELPA